jgi:DNA-binding MarR family transcriptional regulator
MINLLYTSNWVQERLRDIIKPFDITIQQYNVLRILRGAGSPLTTSVIREKLIDKMSDTSRMVDRLHRKGLVNRKQCCIDRRLVDISLTDEGRDVLNQIDAQSCDFDLCLSRLNDEEAETLSALLDKIRSLK